MRQLRRANQWRGVIGLAVLTILFVSTSTNASWCYVLTPDFESAVEESKAVFIGEVVKITKTEQSVASTETLKFNKVTFNVEYSWKGAGFQDVGIVGLVVLASQGDAGMCKFDGYTQKSMAFEEGKKYLVYATENGAKELMVGPGSRTMRVENAADDLKQLRRFDAFLSIQPKRGLILYKPLFFD